VRILQQAKAEAARGPVQVPSSQTGKQLRPARPAL
jgi:hypothetical protein